MKKNILVTSLGTSWAIVPELIGFTNPEVYDLYRNHPEIEKIKQQRTDYGIEPIDELWIVTTNGEKVAESLKILSQWKKKIKGLPKIKKFSYSSLIELNSIDEISPMSDLVYRVTLYAKEETKGGNLFLSLAGGRKNMSADIQNAANIFGCDALFHLMDNRDYSNEEQKKWFTESNSFDSIPDSKVEIFYPVVLQEKIASSPILYVESKIDANSYPILEELNQKTKIDLFEQIKKRRGESANSLLSIYKKQSEGSQTTYSAFQLLPPAIVEQLQSEKIGNDPTNRQKDLEWLKKLPKAELHCHFGGILSPVEIIEVAKVNESEVKKYTEEHNDFAEWLMRIQKKIQLGDIKSLLPFNPKVRIKEYWHEKNIPEPIAISAFIMAFKTKPELLKDYIYYCVGNSFKGIGIDAYEKLGDLQGSSLLQNEVSIRKTCQILVANCKQENIRYIEVRCSPENYIRAGLTAEKVVEIMMEELKSENTILKLIFIASRHGDKETINKHINLAINLLETNPEFKKMFVGFDLAGAEAAASPKELRDDFMQILEKSIPTTIHAGEDMAVDYIWEAVYHLSAERIGHGLTLNDDKALAERFIERKIAIELCPSSNDQIIGYKDYHDESYEFTKEYPLKEYLENGLKVTINTDDPGMSLTNLTKEYYKAACMSKGGLSKWEILQINRNGFKYGFLSLVEKKKLLLAVETELLLSLSRCK